MKLLNDILITLVTPVNILILISILLGTCLGKIYENRKVWVIVGIGMFTSIMQLLKMRIDKLVDKDRVSLREEIQSLRAELQEFKCDVHNDIQEFKSDVHDDIQKLTTTVIGVNDNLESLRTEIYDPDGWYTRYSDDTLHKSDSE
jgi:hypothetical protein